MEKIEKVEPPSWKKPPLPEQSFISLSGKPFIQPKREIPAQEQITLEPELEEALSHATDAEMCDIAGGQPPVLEGWGWGLWHLDIGLRKA